MAVKERLRQVPNGGIGYGLLRYLRNEDDEIRKLQELPHPEVSFHYMGQLDNLLPAASLFKLASSPPRPIGTMKWTRMDITSGILKGQLHFHWLYNKDAYQPATIDHLAQNFIDALENLITHCMSPAAGRYTPSDFPEANLSQQELDDLLRDIDNLGG
jgi:non-ribosomal peptide synthase protein (TIGR01720 family)